MQVSETFNKKSQRNRAFVYLKPSQTVVPLDIPSGIVSGDRFSSHRLARAISFSSAGFGLPLGRDEAALDCGCKAGD